MVKGLDSSGSLLGTLAMEDTLVLAGLKITPLLLMKGVPSLLMKGVNSSDAFGTASGGPGGEAGAPGGSASFPRVNTREEQRIDQLPV